MSFTYPAASDVFDDVYDNTVDWNTYTLPERLAQTPAHMHAVVYAMSKLRNGLHPTSGKPFRAWGIERQHLASLCFEWRCIENFNKLCACEPDIIVDLALLAVIASQDFLGGNPTVLENDLSEDDLSEDDEEKIKVSLDQQSRWSYGRNLEECQVIWEKQNDRVWALCERVAKAFAVPFVRPTEADLARGVVDSQRDQKLITKVRRFRDKLDWNCEEGEVAHIIPKHEAGWRNPRHSPFWLLVSVLCGSLNSAKCYTACAHAQNLITLPNVVHAQWNAGKCQILYEKSPPPLSSVSFLDVKFIHGTRISPESGEAELSYFGRLKPDEQFHPSGDWLRRSQRKLKLAEFIQGVALGHWHPENRLVDDQVIRFRALNSWKDQLPAPCLLQLRQSMWEFLHATGRGCTSGAEGYGGEESYGGEGYGG